MRIGIIQRLLHRVMVVLVSPVAVDLFSLDSADLDGLLDRHAAAVVNGFIADHFLLELAEAVGHALGHDARLIAGGGAQGVHRHGRLEQGLTVHGELAEFPGSRVKLHGEILAGHRVLVRSQRDLARGAVNMGSPPWTGS